MDPNSAASPLLAPGLVGLVGVVAVVVQIAKPFIKVRIRGQSFQDATLQLLAVALGVALVAVQSGIAPTDGASVVQLLSLGVSVGLGAVGGYHVVASSPRPAAERSPRGSAAPDESGQAAIRQVA